ncbi:MAG: hypothetical protein DRP82_01910 [Planctomycetota bacterium]|nr:MAG: hypothetical protein DRP82_01910 [Planctomycetota bacterium]
MAEEEGAMLVDNPILNSPFEEPRYYWDFEDGQPVKREGRRPAGYYIRTRTRDADRAVFEEEFVPLEVVNAVRERVKSWREAGYPGVTPVTRRLLEHWRDEERERPLFFCQLEAIETLIWLAEGPADEVNPIKNQIPLDEPNDPESLRKGYKGLRRYACKMATGSGKTVVMAMLIAWQVLNKVANRQDRRFSDAVLVVCPNLTIKERLQVLLPSHQQNYYQKFDLIPAGMREALARGTVFVTNWQALQVKDDSPSKSVLKRGAESDAAFCRRVLRELGNKKNILVINDEAHHAYRPAQKVSRDEMKKLTAEERKEVEKEAKRATIWVGALDRINSVRGINFCADFSATPFFIKGTGYAEGEPFPWVVSDFGLVDAIECGIVKIPRVPVDDNSGKLIPEYFTLWEHIMEKLPSHERQTRRKRAKPEAVLREAEGAIATLASQWEKTLKEFEKEGFPVPPVMIVVCSDTSLAKVVYDHIARGEVLPELANEPGGQERTIRVDSKVIGEEEIEENESKSEKEERLRRMLATVGKTEWEYGADPPGKNVRCVVSVNMVNEGWDAQNVTQILGLRAFTSQLLCEQVVGRGLRRLNYDDLVRHDGLPEPEYVDVYGVPFSVIPVKKQPVKRGKVQAPPNIVRALPERKHLEITFPRVEGYVFDVRYKVRIDKDKVPYLKIGPSEEPTEVEAKPAAGYRIGHPDRLWPGQGVIHDRNPFHRHKRLQQTIYEIAAEIMRRLKPDKSEYTQRAVLFPQVLEIVKWYISERVYIEDPNIPLEEVALLKYRQRIVDRLSEAILPDTEQGEAPLRPILERFRPIGSTSEVFFTTRRPCKGTRKSHVNRVVLDAPVWENSVAYHLEHMDEVICYVRNEKLDFVIPYYWEGGRHSYRPDYIAKVKAPNGQEVHLILEVKGQEREQDRQKEAAAHRWVKAVNNEKRFGRWDYLVIRDPHRTKELIRKRLAEISKQI